jgi:RES domain-containing protein
VTLPDDWDPQRAVDAGIIIPVKGAVWRGHRRRDAAIDHGGSLRSSARFHQSAKDFPNGPTWPALYTPFDLAVALGELQRNIRSEEIDQYRFTEIWVQLEEVLDCRDLDALGLVEADLFDTTDFETPRALAAAAIDRNIEGIVVPSASRLGDNLIIFPHLVRARSVVVEVRTIDPVLTKHPPDEQREKGMQL